LIKKSRHVLPPKMLACYGVVIRLEIVCLLLSTLKKDNNWIIWSSQMMTVSNVFLIPPILQVITCKTINLTSYSLLNGSVAF
jgi:hypothetical protein